MLEGRTFSHPLEQVPSVFPVLYVAMVRGRSIPDLPVLAVALRRLRACQLDEVRKKIVAASIIPSC
jgi:type II secretory pathway component PulF